MYFIKVYLSGKTFSISSMLLQSIPKSTCAHFRTLKSFWYVVSIAGTKLMSCLKLHVSVFLLYIFLGEKEPLEETFTAYLNYIK